MTQERGKSLKKHMKFGIAQKINLLIIAIIVAFGSLLGTYFVQNQKKTLTVELDQRANALITNMSLNCEYPVLVRDRNAITKLVKDILAQKDIIYCRIEDAGGMLLHEEGAPKEDETRIYVSSVTTEASSKKQSEEDLILGAAQTKGDIETIGRVVLKVSLADFKRKFHDIVRTIAFVVLLFIVVTALATSLLLRFVLGEPIKHLVLGTRRVASGDLSYQVAVQTQDEIGQLATAFNTMTRDLQRTVVSKDYVNNIIKSMIDTLIVLNPDGTIRTVNKATLDLLGYEEDELVGKTKDVFCPEEGAETSSMQELIQKGVLTGVEKMYVAKNGRMIPMLLSGSVMRDAEGTMQGIVCVALDITERKRAEEEIRRSEERYRRLVENAPEVIYCVAKESGAFTAINPAFEKITGWSVNDWIGKSFVPLIHPDDVPLAKERFFKVIEGSPMPPAEMRILSKSGEYLVGEFTSVPQIEHGSIVGEFGIARDITERKKAEKEKEKLHAQLMQQSKLAAVGQLAGGVAHEINNPIGVILGFAQSLVKRIKDDDPFAMPLKSIEREAARCKRLVGDLLTFSRVGKSQAEGMDVNKAIDETLSLVEAKAKMRSIQLARNYQQDLPPLMANRNQLQQVVMNLCNNALDAMPNGGTLTITTLRSGTHFSIQVQDTGDGMTEEVKQRIFEPFFTTKEVGKGTGLGLSLCYEIIQRHNGTIEVESEVSRGTQFTVKLPLQDA